MTELEIYTNPRAYVAHWAARNDWRSSSAEASMQIDYYNEFKAFKVRQIAAGYEFKFKPLASRLLTFAIAEYVTAQSAKVIETDRVQIVGTGENLTPLTEWLTALIGTPTKLDIAVMAHWIWQVKRKAFDRHVVYHIMPVFYGEQGSGKSTAIQKLIEPLQNSWGAFGMDQLGDGRNYQNFANSLVAFFDELQRIQKTDLNVLKNQISATKNTYRILGKNQYATVPMRCSFIGATNTPLNENFSDVTGMRRFYEYKTLRRSEVDQKIINSIDYLALWRGIDENKERGYTDDLQDELTAHQSQYQDEDVIEQFIEDVQLRVPDGGEYRLETTLAVFHSFTLWAANHGIKSWTSQWTTKRLLNKGFVMLRQGSMRYLRVNKAALVGTKALEIAK